MGLILVSAGETEPCLLLILAWRRCRRAGVNDVEEEDSVEREKQPILAMEAHPAVCSPVTQDEILHAATRRLRCARLPVQPYAVHQALATTGLRAARQHAVDGAQRLPLPSRAPSAAPINISDRYAPPSQP